MKWRQPCLCAKQSARVRPKCGRRAKHVGWAVVRAAAAYHAMCPQWRKRLPRASALKASTREHARQRRSIYKSICATRLQLSQCWALAVDSLAQMAAQQENKSECTSATRFDSEETSSCVHLVRCGLTWMHHCFSFGDRRRVCTVAVGHPTRSVRT